MHIPATPGSRSLRSAGRALAVWLLALAVVMPTPSLAAPPSAEPASTPRITILPIDNARFLAGQRFDLRIEAGDNLPENTDPGTFQVTVNGKPLQEFFGKEPAKSNTRPQTAELTLRQVSFNTPGEYTISVSAAGSTASVTYDVVKPQAPQKPAKNVILFVGDGLGWPMLTIARTASKGLTQGRFNGLLEMDRMEAVGYSTTSGYDSLVTDSANGASALATGHKSVVNGMGVYADNTPDPNDDPKVENIAELAKRTRGMATGIVTTSEIEDATPAAMVVHTRRRAEKQFIADQLFDDPIGGVHQPEVIMGGGSVYFIPSSTPGSKRKNDRNLLEEFRQAGYATVGNRAEMKAAGTPTKLLGLFHPGNMNVWIDREYTKDPAVLGPYTDQPTLYEMTEKAIEVLSNSQNGKKNGFFLMVEGASIDKQLHPMDWERAAADTIEMDRAIGVAKQFAAKDNDTLIVVTADHSHSVSLYGTYDATRGPGNRDAVGVYAGAEFPTFQDADGDGFPDSWSPDRTLAVGFGNRPDYRDDFLFNPKPLSPTVRDPNVKDKSVYIPNPGRDPEGVLMGGNLPFGSSTEVHSADDVPLLASGPGAGYFRGMHDNTDVFLGMMSALGVDGTTDVRTR